MIKISSIILGLILLISSSSIFAKQIFIDALIVYSPEAERYRGKETLFNKINRQVNAANIAFYKSKLNITIRPVGRPIKIDIESGGMFKTFKDTLKNKQLITAKKEVNADIALIYTNLSGYEGVSRNPQRYNEDTNTNAVMAIKNIWKYTTIHEIGHILGLGHSIKNPTGSKRYTDSQGHGVDGEFVTIMAYSKNYTKTYRGNITYPKDIGVFSSPSLKICNRKPCGNHGVSNAVRTIQNTAQKLANISNIANYGNGSIARQKALKKYNTARSSYRQAYYVYRKAYSDYRRRKINYSQYKSFRSKYARALTKYMQAKDELRKFN